MGTVLTEITVKNAIDVGNFNHGDVKAKEVRQTTVTAIVDTGAATLVITEKLREQLGLEIKGYYPGRLANNETEMVKIVEPVEIHWKNRFMTCDPWVISGDGEILLGAIPLENMDLIVDPKNQKLVGRHGDEQVGLIL